MSKQWGTNHLQTAYSHTNHLPQQGPLVSVFVIHFAVKFICGRSQPHCFNLDLLWIWPSIPSLKKQASQASWETSGMSPGLAGMKLKGPLSPTHCIQALAAWDGALKCNVPRVSLSFLVQMQSFSRYSLEEAWTLSSRSVMCEHLFPHPLVSSRSFLKYLL